MKLEAKLPLMLASLSLVPAVLLGTLAWREASPLDGDAALALLAVALSGGVAVAAVAFLLLRALLTRRLRALQQAAGELGRGNALVPIDVQSRDELGDLAQSLRTMGHHLKQSSEQIRYLAYHDSLTELPNRALLEDRLGQACWPTPCAASGHWPCCSWISTTSSTSTTRSGMPPAIKS